MKITKEFSFEASHILPKHPGKCSRLHGHSYKVIVCVDCTIDPGTGFVMDYGDMKRICGPFIDRFDHRHLNEFIAYPSAENIAINLGKQMYAELKAWCRPRSENIGPDGYERFTSWVQVQETENTSATWSSDEWSETEDAELVPGWMPPHQQQREILRSRIELLEEIGK